MYRFSTYRYREALYRFCSDREEDCRRGIREARREIEEYIRICPEFETALEPLPPLSTEDVSRTPLIVRRMIRASELTGTGPMAAVAGAIAEAAGEKTRTEGAELVVIENGGDIYLGRLGPGASEDSSITVGLYTGPASPLAGRLALKITASMLPAGLCSSSSLMGHSLSFGLCDLATVYADDTAVADACATLACNLIRSETDMKEAMDRITAIEGVRGILCVLGDKLGMAGSMPELTPAKGDDIVAKVTRHERSGFRI